MSSKLTQEYSLKALDKISSINKLKNFKSKPQSKGIDVIRPAQIDLNNPNSPARLWPNLLQKDSNDKQSSLYKESSPSTPKKEDLKKIFDKPSPFNSLMNCNNLAMEDIYIDMPLKRKVLNSRENSRSLLKQHKFGDTDSRVSLKKDNYSFEHKKGQMLNKMKRVVNYKVPFQNFNNLDNEEKAKIETRAQTFDKSSKKRETFVFEGNFQNNTPRHDYSIDIKGNRLSSFNQFESNRSCFTARQRIHGLSEESKKFDKMKFNKTFTVGTQCVDRFVSPTTPVPGPGSYEVTEKNKTKICYSLGHRRPTHPQKKSEDTPKIMVSYRAFANKVVDEGNNDEKTLKKTNKFGKSALGIFGKRKNSTCETTVRNIYGGPGEYQPEKMPKQNSPEYTWNKGLREASSDGFQDRNKERPPHKKLGPGQYEWSKKEKNISEHRTSPGFSFGNNKRTSEAELKLRSTKSPGIGSYEQRSKIGGGRKTHSMAKDKMLSDLTPKCNYPAPDTYNVI